MFWIRYRDASNALVETSLVPGPTDVEYPEGDGSKVTVTQDGATVVQRPLRDGRPRKWIWRGYARDDVRFSELWTLLQGLTSLARRSAALSPTVEVWEDVSGAGGFDRTEGTGAKVYTTVKVQDASRKPSGAGPVFYESSVTFYVEDPSYTA